MNLAAEYKLSLYDEISTLNTSDKNNIFLVKNQLNNRVYIKKVISTFNSEIYHILMNNPHKNISKIYEVIELDGELIVIEEFINGPSLEEILQEESTLYEGRVIEYIKSIGEGLRFLHELDTPIIHRDIKLSNIMISSDGVLKIIDFDAARLYKENSENYVCNKDTVLLGTAGFAPPEQYGFAQTDWRSDIYSLGVVINYLLTGNHPSEEIYQGQLTNIIKKATNLQQDKRYNSINELLDSIPGNSPTYSKGKMKLTPPGFRRGKPIYIISSLFMYMLVASLFYDLYLEGKNILLCFPMPLGVLSVFFILTNYLGIKKWVPYNDSNIKSQRVFGLIASSTIALFFFAAIEVLLEKILGI